MCFLFLPHPTPPSLRALLAPLSASPRSSCPLMSLQIPLGSTVKLAVSTFNRHSLRFTSCPQMVVDAELNRQDVVSISTTANELTVEARTLGYAMMGVGTSLYPQPTQKDFVLVRVVNGISPLEATLLLGESLTFEANKVQGLSPPNNWSFGLANFVVLFK